MLESLSGGHETHAVHVAVVLVASVNLVGQHRLEQVVELVLHHVVVASSKQGVYPERVVGSVSVLIVLDHPQAASQSVRVQAWVQGISRRVQGHQSGSRSSELLAGQVLVVLPGGELLIALGGFVLSNSQLGLELVN